MPTRFNTQRIDWIDAAKGMCILMVVLYHTMFFVFKMGLMTDTLAFTLWNTFVLALRPMRMPLFFMISGFLAHSAVYRTAWRDVFHSRIASLLWLYGIWLLADWGVCLALYHYGDPTLVPGAGTLPVDLSGLAFTALRADTGIWYLYGLVIYFVICRLGRHHVGLTLTAIGVVSVFHQPLFGIEFWSVASLLANAIFFALGCFAKPFITRHAREFNARRLLIASCATLVLLTISKVYPTLNHMPGVRPLASVAMIITAIDVTAWATAHFRLKLLRNIGRVTLPIYVMHCLIIAGVAQLLGPLELHGLTAELYVAVMPPLLAAATVLLCLGIYRLANRRQGQVLFTLPSRELMLRTPALSTDNRA
ncbi:putative membrane protein YcfT [Kushneria sinocarnis]|uniref:Putative membrane protein YcfT n=1 Tax=Kushneria sinocarnis TaxID=595502 RepID=A0A420X184_9GAMM|nr:acyltransferase family protein [Kushneria sinocarnis]RKR07510.1 putative membrane protein YcfT [Kushneria sinocarnis]